MGDEPSPMSAPSGTGAIHGLAKTLSPWASMSSFLTNGFKILSAVAIVTGGSVAMIKGWLGTKVDHYIDSKIEPYDRLVYGTTFVRDGKFEAAIDELEPIIGKMVGKADSPTERARVGWLVEVYLQALQAVDEPEKYSVQFNQVLELVQKNKVVADDAHNNYIGWYYFRSGDLPNARVHFCKSLATSSGRQLFYGVANNHYALSLVDMAEGKADEAFEEMQEAFKSDSMIYQRLPPDLAMDKWLSRLRGMYQPRFEKSYYTVYDRIFSRGKTDKKSSAFEPPDDPVSTPVSVTRTGGKARF